MLSLQRRRRVLELAVQYQTLIIGTTLYGDLCFDAPPPPSLLALSLTRCRTAERLAGALRQKP